MNSIKLLKMADGGAIEKIPLAVTAVASSIKHQKKPLKEGKEQRGERETLKRAQQAEEAQN